MSRRWGVTLALLAWAGLLIAATWYTGTPLAALGVAVTLKLLGGS